MCIIPKQGKLRYSVKKSPCVLSECDLVVDADDNNASARPQGSAMDEESDAEMVGSDSEDEEEKGKGT